MSKQDLTEKQRRQKQAADENRRIYAKYGGMAFTLAGAVVMGVLIGQWLDARVENDTPYWTAGMALLFLCVGMYSALRDILFPPKKDKK